MSQSIGSTSWGRADRSGAGSPVPVDIPSSRRVRRSRFSILEANPEAGTPSKKRRTASSTAVVGPRATVDDLQTSLTLDSSQVVSAFTRNGQQAGSVVQNTPSLTSPNNFINFCATVSVPITNGQQLVGGSCNPAPMGLIPSSENMPSVLISRLFKDSTIQANTTFPVDLSVRNFQGGFFASFSGSFQAAPQTLDGTGNIIGNFHIVIDELDALDSTVPTDSQKFVFFNVIQDAVSDGEISTNVTNGLPEGYYRMTVTPRAANHQPVLVPLVQRGSVNDVAYFTVTASGEPGSTPATTKRSTVPHQPAYIHPRRRVVVPRADSAAQSSTTLLSSVIAPGFAQAQDTTRPGQIPSLTTTNNFINFCATSKLPLTSGTQLRSGFCNPAPMGVLPASTQMPSSKFTYPRNGDVLAPNAPMKVGLALRNLATGNLVNSNTNFMSAPQQLDSNGLIQGRAFIVIETVGTTASVPADPVTFAAFKGMSGEADSTGVITTDMVGLPVGFYRLSSIIVASNGQPVLSPVLQHGAVDDAVYFVVASGGGMPTNQTALPSSSVTTSGSATLSPSPSPTAPAASVPPPTKTNVGVAVGGAIAGVVVVLLAIFGIWLFVRRRNRQAELLVGYPAVLNSEDFGPPPPTPFAPANSSSMSQISSPSAAVVSPSKRTNSGHSNSSPISPRRASVVSAAPSYHTQV
ncbi:hypothetical protein R3P38DRAFT_541993 [Favolaschia claudopus]|uniref:Uncharacterized protein n=1 Tax=Favolaschia claudopus TaxID=2862362 RepID=A0AAW0CKF6_9AGAR